MAAYPWISYGYEFGGRGFFAEVIPTQEDNMKEERHAILDDDKDLVELYQQVHNLEDAVGEFTDQISNLEAALTTAEEERDNAVAKLEAILEELQDIIGSHR